MDEWREVAVCPNYEISRYGIVRNASTKKMLQPGRRKGYLHVSLWMDNVGKTHSIHRLVAAAFIPNPEEKPFIDHIDGDRTNNCVENLRWATNAENMRNCGALKNNTSGIRGVHWNREKRKWSAKIKVNYRNIHLGYFASIEEAAAARRFAARKLFGEYAHASEK